MITLITLTQGNVRSCVRWEVIVVVVVVDIVLLRTNRAHGHRLDSKIHRFRQHVPEMELRWTLAQSSE